MARQLIGLGFDAAALEGGYAAWRATYPVEPKGTLADVRSTVSEDAPIAVQSSSD